MRRFVGAIDQGTDLHALFDLRPKGRDRWLRAEGARGIYPRPGWVEHAAAEIWRNTVATVAEALEAARLTASDLIAVASPISARRRFSGQAHGRAALQRDRLAGYPDRHPRSGTRR